MPTTLVIVGTAGMGADAGRGTAATYERMVMMATTLVRRMRFDVVAASGAPWAGHVGVGLVAGRVIPARALRLVVAGGFEDGGFAGPAEARDLHERAHRAFRQATGIDSLGELDEAVEAGAVVEAASGLRARDAALALADVALAFTYGGHRAWAVGVSAEATAEQAEVAGASPRRVWDLMAGRARAHVTLGC